MSSILPFVTKLLKQQHGLVTAGILLAIMALVLLLPTIKTLRTVEIQPENEGILLTANAPLVNAVLVPAGKPAYFMVWLNEKHGIGRPGTADYQTMTLEVSSPEGQVVRSAAKPALIKRDDKSALLFTFDALDVAQDQRFVFVVRQEGGSAVQVQQPLRDQVKKDEVVAAAFQLGEQRNWLTLLMDKVYEEDLVGHDISFYLHRGIQIVHGDNPYTCAREGSCIGYPAHLPGMYLVAAGFVAAGIDEIEEWAKVWRPIVLTVWLGVGIVLLIYILRLGQPALAVAAFGFWLFNRWSLDVLRVAHIDFVGVFFLLLAIVLAGPWPLLAAFLLGVSLAVKQVAVLVVPVFLLCLWRHKNLSAGKVAVATGLVLLVPVLTLLPFLLDDAGALVKGLLNIIERPAQSVHGFAPSFDAWLDVTHIGKSLLMLFLVGAVYAAVWRKTVNLIGGTVMVLAIMIAFTHVLYNQYFVWLIPFIPLVAAGMPERQKADEAGHH